MKKRLLTFIIILAAAAAVTIFGPGPASAQEVRPRVISLYAAHTEVLLRLGARDNIIGVSAQETYQGPETEGWKRPPSFSIHDDVEKYLALRPDLVLVRPQHLASGSRLVETLRSSGVKVHSIQVLRAGDLYQYWRELAKLVNRVDQAEEMIADFDRQISAYHEAADSRPERDRPGVFVEAIHGRVKTFTPDSLPIWLVELAGGRNVADDAKAVAPGLMVADYGPERLLSKADEVDIFIAQEGAMNPGSLKQLKGRDIYRKLPAFAAGRVYKIDESLLSRPTPSLLEGLELISAWTGLEVPGVERRATASPAAAPPSLNSDLSLEEEAEAVPAPTPASDLMELKVDLPPQP